MTLLPLLGHNEIGLSETAIGMVFTVIALVNFATLYVAGSLSDRFGRKVVIVPSGILTAAAVGLYVYAGTGATFLAVSILLGIGTGLGGPAPAAYVADLVPAGMVGPAMGLYRTISDLGLVLGPVLLGAIVDAWGYDPAFAVNAALMLLSTLLFAVAARETTGKNRRS
jgi:DHA1 family multidrug resistance protein-like MFS transporter